MSVIGQVVTHMVLKYKDDADVRDRGRFVALDTASGGYPTPVELPTSAKLWTNREEALKYAAMFPRKIEQKVFIMTTTVTEE